MLIKQPKLICSRCHYVWIPRIEDVRTCPRCKSALFDKPKKSPYYKPRPKHDLEWFKQRLIAKRGENIINDILACETKPLATQVDIARKYGLTRERIRQIYAKLTGKKWKVVKSERDKDARNDIGCRRDPRQRIEMMENKSCLLYKGTEAEVAFINECIKRGFKIDCPSNTSMDTIVNGKKIEIKLGCAIWTTPNNKTAYIHANIRKSQTLCDFVAIYHGIRKSWFIIPIRFITQGGSLYIQTKPSTHWNAKNKYWEFEDAWHLLELNKSE